MTRLNFALILVVYLSLSMGITFAQDDLVRSGGTVRG